MCLSLSVAKVKEIIDNIFTTRIWNTVPTKSLETTCHLPITFHYNTMSYQIKKETRMHFKR